jgi:hypothetical protein
MKVLKVLFDHTIVRFGKMGEYRLEYESKQPGRNYLAEIVYRKQSERNDWLQKEIDCLPVIANFAQEGRIKALSSEELKAENRVPKFPSSEYNVFTDVKFEKALAPLARSKWGLSKEQYLDKEDIIKYCLSFFLSPSSERIEQFISGMRTNSRFSLSAFEEKCLRRTYVFKAICHGIDRMHYPDALHLWTAEENGLDVFLTMDRKFRNVLDRQNINLNCCLMFPSELVVLVGDKHCEQQKNGPDPHVDPTTIQPHQLQKIIIEKAPQY